MKKLFSLARAVFDTHRLQIIKLLQIREMCVCELAESLGLSSPRMSQHLAALRRAKVVRERREGKWIYYSLVPKTLEDLTRSWESFLRLPMEEQSEMKAVWQRFDSLEPDQIKQACEKSSKSMIRKKDE